MMILHARLDQQLHAISAAHRWRTRYIVDRQQGPYLEVANNRYLNFAGNDYLGLSVHADLEQAMTNAFAYLGSGTGGSQIVCGFTKEQAQLETALAQFLGYERVLLFGSGYLANVGLLTTLLTPTDFICIDRFAHASLFDALAQSKLGFQRYRHNDLTHLEQLLTRSKEELKYIISDGVFSMEGDIAPLKHFASMAQEHMGILIVDDAHGIGVLGAHGRGCIEELNLSTNEVPILVGSLSKAFGCYGGFVASSAQVIETLIQKSRPALYTTALPPTLIATGNAALQLIQKENWRRVKLKENINYFVQGAMSARLPLVGAATPIQCIYLPDFITLEKVTKALWSANIWVGMMRPPTVPARRLCLRLTLSTLHEKQHIEYLLDVLNKFIPDECKEQRVAFLG